MLEWLGHGTWRCDAGSLPTPGGDADVGRRRRANCVRDDEGRKNFLLAPGGNFVQVAMGERACALDASGALVCWASESPPYAPLPARRYRAISVRRTLGCALDEAGEISCWNEGTPRGDGVVSEA